MTNRTAQLLGHALNNDTEAEITIKFNQTEVFSGKILTEFADAGISSLSSLSYVTSHQNWKLCAFPIDKNITGNTSIEIKVNKGQVYFSDFLFNFAVRSRKVVTIASNKVPGSTSNFLDVTNDSAYANANIVGNILSIKQLEKNLPIGNCYRFIPGYDVTFATAQEFFQNGVLAAHNTVKNNEQQIISDAWANPSIDGVAVNRLSPSNTIFFVSNFDKNVGFYKFVLNQGQTFTGNFALNSGFLLDPDLSIEDQLQNIPWAFEDPDIDFDNILNWSITF